MSTTHQQHYVFWHASFRFEHAFIRGAAQGDRSVCGLTAYDPEPGVMFPTRCKACEALTLDNLYTETIYNRKATTMATAKTPAAKAAPKKKQSDVEVLVEEMKAAAKRHGLCDTFYTELAKANRKLANPLPDELVVKKRTYSVEVSVNGIVWNDGPAGTYGGYLAGDRNPDVKAFKDGLQKAIQDFIDGYTPGVGTFKKTKPTVRVGGYESGN